jgi:hypothetical protein
VLAIYRSLRGLPRGGALRGDQNTNDNGADTCRKYVVPPCLGGGGNSVFCGLKTLAFSLQPLAFAVLAFLRVLLPLLRNGGSLFCSLKTLAFSLQPLAFAVLAFPRAFASTLRNARQPTAINPDPEM